MNEKTKVETALTELEDTVLSKWWIEYMKKPENTRKTVEKFWNDISMELKEKLFNALKLHLNTFGNL